MECNMLYKKRWHDAHLKYFVIVIIDILITISVCDVTNNLI